MLTDTKMTNHLNLKMFELDNKRLFRLVLIAEVETKLKNLGLVSFLFADFHFAILHYQFILI